MLKEILGDVDAVIPDHLDQVTLWKIILNMVSEPPRRKKLTNVNTLQDVVELIRNSKKIIILTGKIWKWVLAAGRCLRQLKEPLLSGPSHLKFL